MLTTGIEWICQSRRCFSDNDEERMQCFSKSSIMNMTSLHLQAHLPTGAVRRGGRGGADWSADNSEKF
jgi:hypothetical protein